MKVTDNSESPTIALTDADEITVGQLLRALRSHQDKPLVFYYEGNRIRPGYHVTEVKAASFSALDCGANAESWKEIFVQLWDVDEGERTHMSAGKFSAIIRKVSDHVALDESAKLTFEVSDGVRPLHLHCAVSPVTADTEVRVELSPRPASCKPRDRWLEDRTASGACCRR